MMAKRMVEINKINPIQIRLANEKDISCITEIYNQAVLRTTATFDTEIKTESDRLVWLSKHSSSLPVIVAEKNGLIMGWGSLSLWSDRCAYSGTVENSVYIDEKFRGQGIGKALLKELLRLGKLNNYTTVIARITEGNEVSVNLHRALGFESIGIMKKVGKKFGKILDVQLMQILL